MITCTSEMSGSASRGICLIAQMPATTSSATPAKTRNRLREHQSMSREIMLHASRGGDVQLLRRNRPPVLLSGDCDLPSPTALEINAAFVCSIALISEICLSSHRCHAHCRHRGHKERDGDLRTTDGSAI